MAIKHSITLSTTEPNNEVGVIKIRQADEQTQTLEVQITENGVPKSYQGLAVYFCAKLGQTAGLGIIEQKLKPEEMTNPANGKLEYTMRAEDWQILGRQRGYFSFRKMKDEHEFVEQFTTRDFTYNVIPSVTGEIREVKKDGSTYIWTIEEMIRLFKEYISTGKIDWENYKNDERILWEKFVEDNREFLETADPGGKIILELLGARGGAQSLGERLDGDKAEVTAQLAQTKEEFKTKRTHMTALSGDTKAPFEIHNQAGQDGADVSSEVTHHYTDATAKVIDNVGNGTILMLSNAQNTVMRPDKGADFVGNGPMLKYRKFNNATKLYEEILNIDSKGNIERKNVDEAFNLIVRKANNGYPAFSIDSATAQTIPVNFRNGGSFITFQDEVNFTKAVIASASTKTTGLELRAGSGSLYLSGSASGTVQVLIGGVHYNVQGVVRSSTRPTTLPVGSMMFDTTLGKPIWLKAVGEWVDATGAIV